MCTYTYVPAKCIGAFYNKTRENYDNPMWAQSMRCLKQFQLLDNTDQCPSAGETGKNCPQTDDTRVIDKKPDTRRIFCPECTTLNRENHHLAGKNVVASAKAHVLERERFQSGKRDAVQGK